MKNQCLQQGVTNSLHFCSIDGDYNVVWGNVTRKFDVRIEGVSHREEQKEFVWERRGGRGEGGERGREGGERGREGREGGRGGEGGGREGGGR